MQDEFSNIVEHLKNSDELILISESKYGCQSAPVKKVFERCIGYVLPHFTIRNNEIHHKGIVPDICTFELSDNQNIDDLLKRKTVDCYQENREDFLLEYKIVLKMLKKDD